MLQNYFQRLQNLAFLRRSSIMFFYRVVFLRANVFRILMTPIEGLTSITVSTDGADPVPDHINQVG